MKNEQHTKKWQQKKGDLWQWQETKDWGCGLLQEVYHHDVECKWRQSAFLLAVQVADLSMTNTNLMTV